MSGISNSLRERLGARPEPQVHPDADLLTAYIEQCLPAAERNVLQQHLAECAPCREIVALSQPVAEELLVRPSVAAKPARSWMLGFRWAAIAACAALAVALLVERPWQPTQLDMAKVAPVAKQVPLSDSSSAKDQVQEPRADKPIVAAASGPIQPAGRIARNDRTLSAAASVPARTGSVIASSEVTSQPTLQDRDGEAKLDSLTMTAKETNALARNELPSEPAPRPSSANELSGGFLAPSLPQQSFVNNSANFALNQKDTKNSRGLGSRLVYFGKAFTVPTKKIAHPDSGGFSTSAMFGSSLKVGGSQTYSSPALEIDGGPGLAANSLRSSNDDKATVGGLAGTEVRSARAKHMMELRSSTFWAAGDEKLLAAANAGGLGHFTVIVSHESEVWAGGSHAALIHSADSGATWENVKLGETAAGDIVRITGDQATLLVMTSEHQLWVSHDGGKSWALQN